MKTTTYELRAGLDYEPDSIRLFFEQYAITTKIKASTIYSDGGMGVCFGYTFFIPLSAGLASAGIMSGITGPVGGIAMIAGGAILDVISGVDSTEEESQEPYPVATAIRVEWLNVSAQRAIWAERLLCSYCQRNQIQILSKLLDRRNLDYAQRERAAPIPWGSRRPGKPKKRRGLFDWI